MRQFAAPGDVPAPGSGPEPGLQGQASDRLSGKVGLGVGHGRGHGGETRLAHPAGRQVAVHEMDLYSMVVILKRLQGRV